VSLSDEKAMVAGATITCGEGITDPELVKTFPEAVPIRRKSQHPSVEKVPKVTRIYPVALVTVCLQLMLGEYVNPVFVCRVLAVVLAVNDPDGHSVVEVATCRSSIQRSSRITTPSDEMIY
jgi:hypothetical protein